MVLKHPKGRSNPTVVMEHDQMDEAAWFWCGGSAPVHFVLGYTDLPASSNGIVTLCMRFADAKHTNTVLVLCDLFAVGGGADPLRQPRVD